MQKNYKSLLKRNIKGVNFYVDTFSSSDIYFENNIFNTEIDLKAILDYFYYVDNKYCPLSITIELLNSCNFNCGFCYIHNRNFSKQIDFNQLISILKILIKNGLLHCVLTGGEIFMYPEFVKLYTFLKENGVLVTLFTNLSLLNDNILTVLKKYKPFNVDVTLYGFNQQVFESTTNAKNIDCKSILKNIKLLKTNGINVSCKTLNVASNICDFDVIKEWCKKENINFRYSSNLFSKYNGDFPIEYQINNNDIYYQKYKEKTLTKNNKKIIFSCSVSKYSLFLGYDLKIRPCWKFYKVDDFMISVSDKNIISSINSLQEKIGLYYGKVLKGCKGCFAYPICNECIVNELADKNYNIKNSCKKNLEIYRKLKKGNSDKR